MSSAESPARSQSLVKIRHSSTGEYLSTGSSTLDSNRRYALTWIGNENADPATMWVLEPQEHRQGNANVKIRNSSTGEYLYTGSNTLDSSRRYALTWIGNANADPAMMWVLEPQVHQDNELEDAASLKERINLLEAEVRDLRLERDSLLAAMPRPPASVTTFQAPKFQASWAMVLTVFTKAECIQIDNLASELIKQLERVRTELLLPLLFDQTKWHPRVPGGGLHWYWDLYDDDFDGEDKAGGFVLMHEGEKMPGFDGIPYKTLRQPILDAFKLIQDGPAKKLTNHVQDLADRVYRLIPSLVKPIPAISSSSQLTQPVLFEEFSDLDYKINIKSEEGAKLCHEALQHLQGGSISHIAKSTLESLRYRLKSGLDGGTPTYFGVILAKMLLVSNSFHRTAAEIIQPHGDILHGPFKSPVRIDSKVLGEYNGESMARPQCMYVKDFLRVTVVVDNHPKMADAIQSVLDHQDITVCELRLRLEEPTHDVIAAVRFAGIIAEFQFTFKSVLLMKHFSHAAYVVCRVDANQPSSARDILNAVFTIPREGARSAGNYSLRKRDQVQLKLSF